MSVVIVAINDSASCRRAVDRAATLFDDADVIVATVVRGCPIEPEREAAGAVRAATREIAFGAATDAVADACRTIGPRARGLILSGEPVEELCGLAVAEQAEAIVVGSLDDGPLAGALGGSIGADLQRAAPCSVVELG